MRHNNRRSDRRDRGGQSNFSSFRSDHGHRGFSSGPREMHKTKCSDCGDECEVPFKPTQGKPVYCRSCFAKHKPQRF